VCSRPSRQRLPCAKTPLTSPRPFVFPARARPRPQELTVLTERLSRINEDLARKMQARNEFDQTIQETEAAYMKVRRGGLTRR
jgi:hypothetical protein